MCAEAIRRELNISIGNANMNLRELVNWGLIRKEHKPGDRKDYFCAEKDFWKMSRRIIAQRKKRELEPIRDILHQLQSIEDGGEAESATNGKQFKSTVNGLCKFVDQADKMLDRVVRSDKNWVNNALMRIINS